MVKQVKQELLGIVIPKVFDPALEAKPTVQSEAGTKWEACELGVHG